VDDEAVAMGVTDRRACKCLYVDQMLSGGTGVWTGAGRWTGDIKGGEGGGRDGCSSMKCFDGHMRCMCYA
jgi:hypothetical protein